MWEESGLEGDGLNQHEKLDALYDAGLIKIESNAAWPIYERRIRSDDGPAVGDIWAYQPYTEGTVHGTTEGIDADVSWIKPRANENTGWQTQKPLALYSRIIMASSNKGDVVLDPFCGCATTCVAAEKLDRSWIGIDIDPMAETVTKARLKKETGIFRFIDGNPVTVKKNPPKRTDMPSVTDAKLRLALWNNQGKRCANPYCDSVELRTVDLHLDHKIPKSRGGEDGLLNRIGLCQNCNSRKGIKAWGTFLDQERSKQPHPAVGQS